MGLNKNMKAEIKLNWPHSLNIPKLPFGLTAQTIVVHGDMYYIYTQDGNYSLCLTWDGVSDTWDDIDVQINWQKQIKQ